MELPFELSKNHKSNMKGQWKYKGLITDKFEEIYQRYIYSTNCELCGEEYKSRRDRHMEHSHQTGEFRNICCRTCNSKKRDVKMKSDNISGYRHIFKERSSRYKQGFTWRFEVTIDCKNKKIKTSTDLEKLIKFRDEWLEKNNYYT